MPSTELVDRGRRPPAPGYRGKRVFDLAALAVSAPISVPLGVLCAIAVRLDSPGPVFFRQIRVGLNGKAFTLWKFRTMAHGSNGNSVFPEEGRITRAGRVLRRTSLDELPQLVNVLRGDMSLVGPRPTLSYQVERYTPRQWQRLSVRPGLTGLAQIRGRNSLNWDQRIKYDLEYISNQSFIRDVRILAETLGVLCRGTGLGGHPRDDPLAADFEGKAKL